TGTLAAGWVVSAASAADAASSSAAIVVAANVFGRMRFSPRGGGTLYRRWVLPGGNRRRRDRKVPTPHPYAPSARAGRETTSQLQISGQEKTRAPRSSPAAFACNIFPTNMPDSSGTTTKSTVLIVDDE